MNIKIIKYTNKISSFYLLVRNKNDTIPHEEDAITNTPAIDGAEDEDSIHSNMIFSTVDDAYTYFRDYSIKHGFAIRKESSRKSNGELCYQMLACSQSGIRRNELSNKKTIRCNCPWNVKVWRTVCKDTKQSSWKVSSCINTHNHDMLYKPGSIIGDAQSSSSAPFSFRKHMTLNDGSVKDGSVKDESVKYVGLTRRRSDSTIVRDNQLRKQKSRYHTLSGLAKTWISLSVDNDENFKFAEEFLVTSIQQLQSVTVETTGDESMIPNDQQTLVKNTELPPSSSSSKDFEPPQKKRRGKAHTENVH